MAEVENSQSLRNSTGKLKVTAKGVDIGPNYLRASSGSCHDACKYGTPHVFKAIPKRPARRRSMPKDEIPVEILVDKRTARAVKSSSVVPGTSISTKPEVTVSGRSPSVGATQSGRQQAPSSMKVRSSHVLEKIDQEIKLDEKYLPPDLSNSGKQESSLDVSSSSPDSSKLVKPESSLDMSFSPPDSSVSAKQESFLSVKSSSPDSSTLAMQESSLDMKSSQPASSISVKKGSSSDVISRSTTSFMKGSSSERPSGNAPKSTIQDVQPRRMSSSADVSGSFRNSASKLVRTPRPTSGSVSKTTVTGRKPSSSDASKSVNREVISSDGKAPLKNTSTKLGGSLKSKSTRVRTEQSSPPNLPGRASGNGSNRKRNTGSKIDNDLRTSKEGASKQNIGSPTGSSSLKTRKNPKVAVKNILTSSTRKKPNLPGTKVVSSNVTKKVAQTEGSSKVKATSDYLNGCSDSMKPENDKVPEKTLHAIEVESSSQKFPGSDHRGSSDIIQSQLSLSTGSLDSLCQSKSPFSSQDAVETNSASEYTESEVDDSDSYCDDDALDMNRSTPGKRRVLNHEGNGSALVKLKFRRGKVLDPQSEVKSPRRLRFRRRSTSGKDLRVNNERRRSFKGRDAGGNIDETKPVGVKVVLRHQDVQEKKSEHGLLNNMIEETANKLVGTRRSKVLALVGAFETVISLQEGKSSGGKPSPHSSPGM